MNVAACLFTLDRYHLIFVDEKYVSQLYLDREFKKLESFRAKEAFFNDGEEDHLRNVSSSSSSSAKK